MQREYASNYGESIFEVAVKTYGSSEYIFKLIEDNPSVFENLGSLTITGQVIIWDDAYKISSAGLVAVPVVNDAVIVGQWGQSLYDVCLQTYGSLNNLFVLMRDNEISNLNAQLLSQRVFTFDKRLVADNIILKRNEREKIIYSTQAGYFNPALQEDLSFEMQEDGSISMRE